MRIKFMQFVFYTLARSKSKIIIIMKKKNNTFDTKKNVIEKMYS